MKKFKKIYCDLCGKNFGRGCDLKVHIQIVQKTLNSNVMNVAKILLKPSTYKLFMKRNTIQFKFSTFTQNFGL